MTEHADRVNTSAVDALVGPEGELDGETAYPGDDDYLGDDDDLFQAIDRLSDGQYELAEAQHRLHAEFEQLGANFERLAGSVRPLLTEQFDRTLHRTRVLETRLRNRQERPLLVRMATLLADVRRLESAEDIKAHVEEALIDALTSAGYQEIGQEGDPFDPVAHEPVSGSTGKAGVVRQVFSRGLECYGDVLIKAKVDVGPVVDQQAEGGFPA